jgi:hypothetical protein
MEVVDEVPPVAKAPRRLLQPVLHHGRLIRHQVEAEVRSRAKPDPTPIPWRSIALISRLADSTRAVESVDTVSVPNGVRAHRSAARRASDVPVEWPAHSESGYLAYSLV